MTRIQKWNKALSWSEYQLNMKYHYEMSHVSSHHTISKTLQQPVHLCIYSSVREVTSNNIITIYVYSRDLLFGGIVAEMLLVSVKKVWRCTINIKWYIIYHIITKCRLSDIDLRTNPSMIVECEYDHTDLANLNTSLGIKLREYSQFKRQPIHREMFLLCATTNSCNNDKQTTVAAGNIQHSQFYYDYCTDSIAKSIKLMSVRRHSPHPRLPFPVWRFVMASFEQRTQW